MKKFLVALFFAIFFLSFHSLAAGPGGSGTRGGGDSTAAEFLDLARQFFSVLESSATISSSQKFLDMKFVFAKTQVFLSLDSKLDLDGVAVTAINIPAENKIILSEPRWKSLTDKEKIRLIAHEFLGLAQADDSQYLFSNIMTAEYFYLLRLDLRDLNKGSYFVVNQDIEFAIGEFGARIYFTERGIFSDFPLKKSYCVLYLKEENDRPLGQTILLPKGTRFNIESSHMYSEDAGSILSFFSQELASLSCYSKEGIKELPFNNILSLNNYLKGLLTLKVGPQ